MSEVRQALAAWEQHLGEVIGVAHGAQVVDRFDHVVTPELLEMTVQRIRLERQADLAAMRGQLMLEVGGQFERLRSDLHEEMSELRTELRGEMAELRTELRGEMAELRTELTAEMAELRTELRGEMAELRTELRTELKGDIAELHTELGRLRIEATERAERMSSQWRRDLLLVTGAQFTALAGAVLVLA